MFQSLACISAKACSRAAFSMVSSGSLAGDQTLGSTEDESSARKYTAEPESVLVLVLWKTPIVYLSQLRLALRLRSFSDVRATDIWT